MTIITIIIYFSNCNFPVPQLKPDAVLDGRRPSDADVANPVRGGRDRVAGLPPRPGLTRTVHRTAPFLGTADVVPTDDQ